MLRFANARAWGALPSWAARAPQQVWPAGTSTRYPARSSNATAARFTGWNHWSWMQPESRATRPAAPLPPTCPTTVPGRLLRSRIPEANRRIRVGASRVAPVRCASEAAPVPARNALRDPRTVPRTKARNRCDQVRRWATISARVPSRSRPYGTRPGQTGSHARQPRQKSMIPWKGPSTSSTPWCTAFMAWIRPRGDAVSLPVNRKVGQAGRQSPHCTQALSSSVVGCSAVTQAITDPPEGVRD